jgi:hypothetical protein
VTQGVDLEFKLLYHKKVNSKWIKELNVRSKILKLLWELNNIRHSIGSEFLNRTPIIARINKWDCIKFKNFCTEKEKITRKDSLKYGRKSLPTVHLIFRI